MQRRQLKEGTNQESDMGESWGKVQKIGEEAGASAWEKNKQEGLFNEGGRA